MTLLTTLARRIDLRGELAEMWEPDEETCIPVATLGAYAGLWRTEGEVEEVRAEPIVPPVQRVRWAAWGDLEERITAYLREHGDGYATMIGREVNPKNVQSVRARMCSMWAEGKLVRIGRGRYRLA